MYNKQIRLREITLAPISTIPYKGSVKNYNIKIDRESVV